METILFISYEDILHYTSISGNIDVFKINPHIYNSQILYIEPILGSDLYSKIETLIDNNTISGTSYYTLLIDYITPSVVFHTMELFVPFNAFQISDGGVSTHTSSNAETSPMDVIDRISAKFKVIGAKYDEKLSTYLKNNILLFPEYQTNTGLVKTTEVTRKAGGLYLGMRNSYNKIRI